MKEKTNEKGGKTKEKESIKGKTVKKEMQK
jgi:hypothetical protein